MNRNNVGNEPGDDFCCADMTSEERARWQEKFAARRRLTTFHQTPNIKIDITKITITDLIAGFAIEQGDHIGIHLYFANLRKLMGEKQIDLPLLNAIGYVLNVARFAGLVEKQALLIQDTATDNHAYEGVKLQYKGDFEYQRTFQHEMAARDLVTVLNPCGVELKLTDATLVDDFIQIFSDLKIPAVSMADNCRLSGHYK